MITQIAKNIPAEVAGVIAGKLEIRGGTYTGKILSYPGSAVQKEKELDKNVATRGIEVDWKQSIAMGDNERDINILNTSARFNLINK